MRYGLLLVVMLAWAMWLGGLMAMFLLVSHLFSADRSIAIVAAPRMFLAFERYQIILAAIALIAATAWRLREPRALLTGLFFAFAVASIGAVISAAIITPRVEQLRQIGQTSSPEFRTLHGRSMIVYTTDTATLLVAGILLASAMTPAKPLATPPPA